MYLCTMLDLWDTFLEDYYRGDNLRMPKGNDRILLFTGMALLLVQGVGCPTLSDAMREFCLRNKIPMGKPFTIHGFTF